MKERVIVLDTSAFIAGFDPMIISEKLFTVPEVRNELNTRSMLGLRLNAAVEIKKVTILKPKDSSLKEVQEYSKKVGDVRSLSKADIQVLALALELSKDFRPVILTDDYSIQNVANKMDIDFTSLLTVGIKKRFQWLLYCPACYSKYPPDYKLNVCEICGTELKRKPKKKLRL